MSLEFDAQCDCCNNSIEVGEDVYCVDCFEEAPPNCAVCGDTLDKKHENFCCSCKNEDEQELQKKYDSIKDDYEELNAVHEELLPKLCELHKLIGETLYPPKQND